MLSTEVDITTMFDTEAGQYINAGYGGWAIQQCWVLKLGTTAMLGTETGQYSTLMLGTEAGQYSNVGY